MTSQFITRSGIEDLCEEEQQSKFSALVNDLIAHAAHAGGEGLRPGLARNGRGGAEPQAGAESPPAFAEVLIR